MEALLINLSMMCRKQLWERKESKAALGEGIESERSSRNQPWRGEKSGPQVAASEALVAAPSSRRRQQYIPRHLLFHHSPRSLLARSLLRRFSCHFARVGFRSASTPPPKVGLESIIEFEIRGDKSFDNLARSYFCGS